MQESHSVASGFRDDQKHWMEEALSEARLALEHDDVPVGAVVVKDGVILGRGHNSREAEHDPTAHAEIRALAQAGKIYGDWRLDGAELYVTLEPCPMCAFALVLARLSLVVYGADDPRMGACGSHVNLVQFPGFTHGVAIRSGLLAEESLALIRDSFVRQRRSASD